MARQPRLVIGGYPHHLIIRGNNRQAVFRDDADRQRFNALLAEVAGDAEVAIHGYVLMTNHVHLVLTPASDNGLSPAIQRLGRHYVRYFNDRHGRSGTLWEGRYRTALVQVDRYLLACLRYVENNPVRAGLVRAPAEYPWSSHRHHVGLAIDSLLSPHAVYWGLGNTPFDRERAWRLFFEAPHDEDELRLLRALASGKPAADRDYLDSLGQRIGRTLVTRPVGRPRRR